MSDEPTLLAKLRAGRVPLRTLLAMAKAPRPDDVYVSQETCTEVLRQLVGHCERLIAESMQSSDLRAGIADLERRFQNWRDQERERVQIYAEHEAEYGRWRGEVVALRGNIWSAAEAGYRLDRLVDRLQRAFPDVDLEDEDE